MTDELPDLLDRHSRTTIPGNPDNVLTRLAGKGLGHCSIFPVRPPDLTDQMSQIRSSAPATGTT